MLEANCLSMHRRKVVSLIETTKCILQRVVFRSFSPSQLFNYLKFISNVWYSHQISGLFKKTYYGIAGGKLIRRIRKMCFEKVVYMEVSWFVESEHSNGARLSTDADSIQHNFTIHTMKKLYDESSQATNDAVGNIKTVD
ncbi:hypothetical protein MTR_8g080430 [Medicago truncatula]|uniref:ABC transmembrane type-1 domain-containing protein n=1 Tax=Medicago truncatula TaxID=3880 RepID=A0A072TT36_MEDTR|nr:hypothetical protein MTR_8g080430 [Medicago truncatula]